MSWFVLGLAAMMLFNSLDIVPQPDKAYLIRATTFLRSVALSTMEVETDVCK